MEVVKIVATSRFVTHRTDLIAGGTANKGSTYLVPVDYARHLVTEAGAAVYAKAGEYETKPEKKSYDKAVLSSASPQGQALTSETSGLSKPKRKRAKLKK